MTTGICRKKTYPKARFTAAFLLPLLFFSCRAQVARQNAFVEAPGSPIVLACGPGNIVAGDLNGDDKPDLVAACAQSRSLTVLLGQGDGCFLAAANGPLPLTLPPNEMATGDVNSDGHLDLVIASHDSYAVLILLGDGKGNLSVSANSPVVMKEGSHPHTHGLGVNDLNGDGHLDIVTANNADNDVAVVFGNGRGEFTRVPGSPFAVNRSPYPLAIGDINNDGYTDIAATSIVQANNQSSKVLTVLWSTGQGDFRRSDMPVRTPNTWFVAIGDVNKDGKPDLLTTHGERSELTVLLNEGNDRFVEAKGSPFNLGSSAWHIALSDVNRDGYTDVIAAANNGVRVMAGDGTGEFKPAPGSPFPTGRGTWRLALSDVNGDGKADVVTSNLESNNVSVLLGR